jgi:hypothetical protein
VTVQEENTLSRGGIFDERTRRKTEPKGGDLAPQAQSGTARGVGALAEKRTFVRALEGTSAT